MDPLSVTASIITIITLTGSVIDYLNDIKDASKDRARCEEQVANLQCLLRSLKNRVKEAKPEDSWFKEVCKLVVENGPLDQFRVAMEELEAKLKPKAALQKIGQMLVWKLTKKEVAEILSRIEQLKSLTQIALEMDHFKLSQAIKNDITGIKGSISNLALGVDSINEKQARQRQQTALDWLSSSDFTAQQHDLIGKRQEGTGLWFINSPKFAEWLHGSKQTLTCSGIPGAGKTMIVSIVIDHLGKEYQDDDIGVAYLYCNYKRRDEQKAVNLLAAILKQLVQKRPPLSDHIVALHELHAKQGTRPSFDDLSKSLRSVLGNYSQVFMIVDALDECTDVDDTRNTLLSEIRNLQTQIDLRLMSTSRPIKNITQAFEGDLHLEIRANNEDVERYLEGQISRRPSCILRKPHLQQLVKRNIVEAVDGMFLLAQLYMNSVMHKKTVKDVKNALAKLSTGAEALNMAYKEARERIDGQDQESCVLAKGVISWITNARRPLTTIELQLALAVEPGERQLDEDNIPEVEDMVSVCAGLVTVDEGSDIIRLVHYTTQEYFERVQLEWIPDALTNIARTCITYLSFYAFASGWCLSDEEFEERLIQNGFLSYAVHYWGDHARLVEEDVKEVALAFLQDNSLVSYASQVLFVPDYRYLGIGYSQEPPMLVTGLHLSAYFGLKQLSAYILEGDFKADLMDSRSRTPLSLSADEGHEEVVKLLLGRDDVDPNSKDISDRTPLSHAAESGHIEVVKLLLAQGDIEADSKDSDFGQTPLSWAAEHGQNEIVKLLLVRNDVKIDSIDYTSRTPLSWAAERGYEEVVKLFLARDDVKVDSVDQNGRTPLSYAAEEGHEEVVKLFLARDDVKADSIDRYGRTPLSYTAEEGHEEVVKLFLARDDVKADSVDQIGLTPLSCAADWGRKEVVKLLLARDDVNPHLADKKGRTPLSYAARRGHEEMVKLLLARDDVNPHLTDKWGRTPLSYAEEKGHEQIVKLLLARD